MPEILDVRPPGWFSDEDGKFYERAFQQFVPAYGKMIEIGTFLGRSLSYIGPKASDLHAEIYCIDPWGPADKETEFYYQAEDIAQRFYTWLKDQPWNKSVITVRARSRQAVRMFQPCSIDMVFIDGDHTYEAVRDDIKLYLPLLKPEGLIAGHDWGRPEVTKALTEIIGTPDGIKGLCWFKKVSNIRT